MLAQTLNELRVELAISVAPGSMVLIKEGRHMSEQERERLEKSRKEDVRVFNEDPRIVRRGKRPSHYLDLGNPCFAMAFVFSRTAAGDRYYLPGSSLRGVLRQAAEGAIAERRPDLAVDPFARRGEPLAGSDQALIERRARDEQIASAAIYSAAWPIERCFGHTLLRGRWTIEDAWPEADRTPGATIRDGVGIDRETGAAREKIKFDFEALMSGTFTTTLRLVNYELWQLGLLAHALAALDAGDVRLGYGTRRGLGRVRWRVRRLAFRWYPERAESRRGGSAELSIPTLSALAKAAGNYGWREDRLALNLTLRYESGSPVGSWVVEPQQGEDPWQAAPWPALGPLLAAGLNNWPRPAVEAP